MGFFDRFASRKPAPAPAAPTNGTTSAAPAAPAQTAATTAASGPVGVKARLAAARERLDVKDLPGAMAIYEELLATAGDRADVLVGISGDLGSQGHVAEIIELIAPRYDADRHGPATGLNLLQAYLAVRNADAAQHVLDILFALHRPELEDRLHGFANAIAEILASPNDFAAAGAGPGAPGEAARIGLITISKPIWFYGLEPLAAQILPPKEGNLRRIAFAQLALPGSGEKAAAAGTPQPEDEPGRLSRAIPLWFAETFYFSPSYAPSAAIAVMTPAPGQSHYVNFSAEWSLANLRQLVETTEGGLDYIVTGALRVNAGDYEVVLRIWEVKTFRERKVFNARWVPATADAALAQLHAQVRAYMEWSPASAALAYTISGQPRPWLETLGAGLGLFLVEKNILPPALLAPVEADVQLAAARAAGSEAASLAFLTLQARAVKLGLGGGSEVVLARSALVNAAKAALSPM
jgi:hypothetical protein